MSRERPGYRLNLEQISERFPGTEMLTVKQVAEFTGLTEQTVRKKFQFNRLTKRISVFEFARLITAGGKP